MGVRSILGRYFKMGDPLPEVHPGYLLWRYGDYVRAILFSEFICPTLEAYQNLVLLAHFPAMSKSQIDRALNQAEQSESSVEKANNLLDLLHCFNATSLGTEKREVLRWIQQRQHESWSRWLEHQIPDYEPKVDHVPSDREPSDPYGVTFSVGRRRQKDHGRFLTPGYWTRCEIPPHIPESYRGSTMTFEDWLNAYLFQNGDLPQLALYGVLFCPPSVSDADRTWVSELLLRTPLDKQRLEIDSDYASRGPEPRSEHLEAVEFRVDRLFCSAIGNVRSLHETLADRIASSWRAWFDDSFDGRSPTEIRRRERSSDGTTIRVEFS